jgi:hypothetical protein
VGGILLVEGPIDVLEQVCDRVALLDQVTVPVGLCLQALDLAQELRRLDPRLNTAVEEIDDAVGPPHDLIDVRVGSMTNTRSSRHPSSPIRPIETITLRATTASGPTSPIGLRKKKRSSRQMPRTTQRWSNDQLPMRSKSSLRFSM